MRRDGFKIWHVSRHPHYMGGVEQNLHALAKALNGKGYSNCLVHDKSEKPDKNYLEPFSRSYGIESLGELESPAKADAPDVVVVHQPFLPDTISELASSQTVIRMVHDHDLVCPRRHKYFPISKKICDKPAGIACYMHGCFVGRGEKLPLGINSISECRKEIQEHQAVAHIVANSKFMKNELVQNGLPQDRISVLAPMPGEIEIQPAPYPSKSNVILFVGQLLRGKGLDLLLRSLYAVENEFRLLVAGDGNARSSLLKLADSLGLADKVSFLGHVPHSDLMALYRKASIVAVPSRWPEPFGMVGVEAMAAARPVVAFAVGGINDWLWHGVNGLGAPEADLQVMARNIDWLLYDKKLAMDLGSNGRRIFEELYRFEDYVAAFEEILKSVKRK